MRHLRELVRKPGWRELALIIFTAFVSDFATEVVDASEHAVIWAYHALT
ncbi:hypothetical protein [Streptomyces sp. NPDC004376]